MQSIRKLSIPLVALALCAGACNTDSSSSMAPGASSVRTLDGKRFEVRLVEKGKSSADADVLEFDSGRFHSTACDAYGFSASPYTTQVVAGELTFHASCTNKAGDRNDWHGTLHGDRIEGAFTWTPKTGAAVEHTYSGAELR